MPRRVEGLSKRKKKIHQVQKGASALRQERSLESASKWLKFIKRNTRRAKGPQEIIQSRDERPKKKEKKREKKKKKKERSPLGWKPKRAV